jgi:uncharacterized membrane protein (UPF0182 family)
MIEPLIDFLSTHEVMRAVLGPVALTTFVLGLASMIIAICEQSWTRRFVFGTLSVLPIAVGLLLFINAVAATGRAGERTAQQAMSNSQRELAGYESKLRSAGCTLDEQMDFLRIAPDYTDPSGEYPDGREGAYLATRAESCPG